MHRGQLLLLLYTLYLAGSSAAQAQSLRRMEHQAVNRTHLTFVNGDTVQRFTITRAHPAPKANRFYYWQGPTQILRTAGAYDGRLLSGAYQLTSRNGNLLGNGTFRKGLKTGLWRTWREDGTPLTSSHWHQGRRRGKVSRYDESGRLLKPVPSAKQPAKGPVAQTQDQTQGQGRIWQPVYWKGKLKRFKIRHRDKAAKAASKPIPAPPLPGPDQPTQRLGPPAPLPKQPGS